MSISYAVRSLGDPYFAAVQENLGGMLSPLDGGSAPLGSQKLILMLWFAVDRLPERLVSDDECHVLFSYHEYGPSGADLAYFGVSPNGRLIGYNNCSGTEIMTAPGEIVANGTYRKLAYYAQPGHFGAPIHSICEFEYEGGERAEFAVPDTTGMRTIATAGGGVTGYTTPSTGRYGTLMLFNGRQGRTRCACSIKRATMFDSVPKIWEWRFDEKFGTTLVGSKLFPAPVDPGLTMQYYNPTAHGVIGSPPFPWGSVPTNDVHSSFRWKLRTPYERIARPRTVYTRIGR